MSQPPLAENREEIANQLMTRLFRPADDLTATVLRGHLAVQQRLITKLEQHLPYPQAFKLSRLQFHFLVQLTKAHTYREENRWVWEAIKALNDARNHLAHEVEAPQLSEKVEKFITCVARHNHTESLFLSTGERDLLARLQYEIMWLWGFIESVLWKETGIHGP